MYKGFLEFVRTEHPDPDSLIGDDYVFIELCKLADNYNKKQLLLHNVSQQRELLYAVCDELEKASKQLIPPSMKSLVVNKVLADNCG